MLAAMRRAHFLRHGSIAVTLSLAVVACSGGTPSPVGVATVPAKATPAPSVDPGALYVKAVVAAFTSDPLVMHVEATAKLSVTDGKNTVKESVSMTVDLSDRDLSAHLGTKTSGKTTNDLDLIVVGTSVYARDGSSRWTKGPRSSVEQNIADVIRAIPVLRDPTHLRYIGVQTIEKRKLQHLTATRPFTYVMSIGQTGTFDTFDIWVEEDGTPVLAKGTVSAVGPYGVEITGTNEFHFSEVGGPIKIAAPKL